MCCLLCSGAVSKSHRDDAFVLALHRTERQFGSKRGVQTGEKLCCCINMQPNLQVHHTQSHKTACKHSGWNWIWLERSLYYVQSCQRAQRNGHKGELWALDVTCNHIRYAAVTTSGCVREWALRADASVTAIITTTGPVLLNLRIQSF